MSGNIVVYTDFSTGYGDIYAFDLSTKQEFPLCTDGSSQSQPAIDGNFVVWEDARNVDPHTPFPNYFNIYGYDLAQHEEFVVSTTSPHEYRPQISGNNVIWQDYRQGSYSICTYDLSTETESTLVQTGDATPDGMDISGDVIVWYQYCTGSNFDVCAYDLSTHQQSVICNDPEFQYEPATNGQVVVWHDRRKGNMYDMDIYGYDLTQEAEFPISTGATDDRSPSVSGNLVVWESDGQDILGWDLATNQPFVVASNFRPQSPKIDGNCVVWTHWNGTDFDVYGATLIPEPSTSALLWLGALSACAYARRWRKRAA